MKLHEALESGKRFREVGCVTWLEAYTENNYRSKIFYAEQIIAEWEVEPAPKKKIKLYRPKVFEFDANKVERLTLYLGWGRDKEEIIRGTAGKIYSWEETEVEE